MLVKPRLGESWCLEMCRRLVEVEGRLTGSSCRKYNEDSNIKSKRTNPNPSKIHSSHKKIIKSYKSTENHLKVLSNSSIILYVIVIISLN